MRAFIAVLLTGLLVGCAASGPSQTIQFLNKAVAYQKSLGFINRNMGYPTDRFDLPNGNTVLAYNRDRRDAGGTGNIRWRCTYYLEFSNGRLVNYSTKGNSC